MLRITWIGHSTVLLDLDGVRLLTDPVVRRRFTHLVRVVDPVDIGALPSVDAVLISHLHYDHLDFPSLARLGHSKRVVVPAGARGLLRRRGFVSVAELAVGEEIAVGGVRVLATTAEHDGRRGPLSSDTPAVGYLVTGSARVYFAGDTDLFEDMSGLSGDLDVALLPIAGWGPRVPAGHLDPLRAAQAVRRLRPRVAIPVHWGTYRRFDLRADTVSLWEPAHAFARQIDELAPDVDVSILSPGGTIEIQPRAPRPTPLP